MIGKIYDFLEKMETSKIPVSMHNMAGDHPRRWEAQISTPLHCAAWPWMPNHRRRKASRPDPSCLAGKHRGDCDSWFQVFHYDHLCNFGLELRELNTK